MAIETNQKTVEAGPETAEIKPFDVQRVETVEVSEKDALLAQINTFKIMLELEIAERRERQDIARKAEEEQFSPDQYKKLLEQAIQESTRIIGDLREKISTLQGQLTGLDSPN